jgi:hypothetical protein
MVAQISSRTGFQGFGQQISSPNIGVPLQTNGMIVVFLTGLNTLSPSNSVYKTPVSVGTNQPATSVQDSMGNSYYRVNTVNNNSMLMNMLLYEEIWVATINSAILKNLVVTVTYPSATIFAGEVIVVTPANPQNQLNVDNAVLTADNVNNVFGNVGMSTTYSTGEPISPTLPNELVLVGINYVYNNQPPTTPPTAPLMNGIGGSNLIDNNSIVQTISSPSTGNQPNTYGFGLAILTQLVSTNNTPVSWMVTTQGQSVCAWITLVLAIQEVAIASLGIQENVVSTPFSPESVSLVASSTPGVNIIKLPLGS